MRAPLVLFLLLLPLALPGSALAEDFHTVFKDYKDNGRLDRCYKPYQLHNAGRQIPPDIEQYAPGFADALTAGQNCGTSQAPPAQEEEPAPPISAGTPGPGAPKKRLVTEPPAPTKVPQPALARLPVPNLDQATAAGLSSELPGALVPLLVAAGIAFLLALAWAIAWFMGWSPERVTKPLTAAFGSVWDRLAPGR